MFCIPLKIRIMLRTLSKKLTTIILILVFGFTMKAQTPDKTFEILKNLEIMGATYKQVYLFYVNETNPGALMKTAIDAMLQSLDPYTVYIPEANIEDVRMLKEGQYEGIGSIIMQRDKKTYIAEVYEHFPAQKAGLKPGDQILAINGTDIAQKNIEEISHLLKGQVNTTLTINIIPLGEKEPKEMSIQREAIHFDNVTYSTLFENQTGYIRLDGFTEGAAKEFKESFLKLKEQGADKLVIDLRNNGGGLMNEAISIVALFIDKGLPVVSMKGKQQENDQTFLTENDPLDKNIPIVVLINRSSASASEILAGALQDYDRAVIMGQRSFGKGLVQNIVPLNYHAQLKITTAKYYVPSGRCVQAIDYGNRDKQGIAHKLPDSLRTAYKTQNGRTVYDGDGIEPDVELATKNLSDIATSLLESYNIFDFEIETLYSITDAFSIRNALCTR